MLEEDTWAARTALTLGARAHADSHELKAEYLGVELSFSTNHDLAAAWAQFFLSSHFSITNRSAGDSTCLFFYGPVNKGAIHDLVQAATQTRVELDRQRAATHWSLGSGRSLTVSDDSDHWYIVDRDAGRFIFLSSSEDPMPLREAARQVRSIIGQLLIVDGWLSVHASAVVANGVGMVFPGDKGAGKTTTMLELIGSSESVAYVSNDRTYGRFGDDGFRVAGFPQTVRLGAGSLQSSPQLRPHLHAWDHFHATLIPLADQVSHPDKLDLTVQEFSDILGCDYRMTTSVAVVAFPELEWESGHPAVRRLDPREAACCLRASTRFPDPAGETWVGTLLYPKTGDSIDAQCASITSATECLAMRGTASEMASNALRYAQTQSV